MDVQGKWVVMPKYFDIDYVDTNQSYIVILPKPTDPNRLVKGVIDKNGKEIIPVKYSTLIAVGKSYLVAEGNDPFGDDKIESDEVEDLLDYLEGEDEETEDKRKWGILNASGNELVPLKYSDISMSADISVLQLKPFCIPFNQSFAITECSCKFKLKRDLNFSRLIQKSPLTCFTNIDEPIRIITVIPSVVFFGLFFQ